MLQWKNQDPDFALLEEALNLIFVHHLKLLEFLFELDRPALRASVEQLLADAGAFSPSEQVLVKVALSLWSETLEMNLCELIHFLENECFERVVKSLRIIKRLDHAKSGFSQRHRKTGSLPLLPFPFLNSH